MMQTFIDLFCGCGGLTEGFRRAGYDAFAGLPPGGRGVSDRSAAQSAAAHGDRAQASPLHPTRTVGYHDVYGRMAFDRPAPTLTTGCTDITRGRFAHPVEDRAITLREAARLQTFPDSYHFCGSSAAIAAQIGNALPPTLAEALARHISELVTERKRR